MYIETPRNKDGVRDWEAEEDAQALLKARQINSDMLVTDNKGCARYGT